jgi:hypothetical protein
VVDSTPPNTKKVQVYTQVQTGILLFMRGQCWLLCDPEGTALSPQTHKDKMDDLFKRTMTDIDMYSKVLKSLATRSMELGLEAKNVTVQRAHLKVDAAVAKWIECENIARELGYGSVPTALKALSQYKEKSAYDISHLPVAFHKVPKLWLVGRASTRKTPGFAPMTLRAAIREHKQIIPLVLEAWELSDEEGQDTLVKEYLRCSAEDFKQQLYNFIYENEETPLEEELIDAVKRQVEREQFEDWQQLNQKKRG